MKLSYRLQTIAAFAKESTRVIDVGCDHAWLDIYLTKEYHIPCIASDINIHALENAKKNICQYALQEEILVVQSDGLKQIKTVPNDTVVLSGMGTYTILNIVQNSNVETFIIQSNNHLGLLRKTMSDYGFFIAKESVIKENDIYYVIILFQKGISSYHMLECELGPLLIKSHSSEVREYFAYIYQKNEQVIKGIKDSDSQKSSFLNQINAYIKELRL